MQANGRGSSCPRHKEPASSHLARLRCGVPDEFKHPWLPAHPDHVWGDVALWPGLGDGGSSAVCAHSPGSGRGDSRLGCHKTHFCHAMSLQMPHTHPTALLSSGTSRSSGVTGSGPGLPWGT